MQHLLDLARPFWPLILALVVWPIVGAALSWWLWWDTPAHWDAYAAAHPGRALAIRALRTVSPHLRKLVVAWRDYAAVRSSLPPLSVLAEKQGALDASETRPPGIAHPAQLFAPSFDPTARQTIAPEVVAAARDATRDGQRGHTSLSAALAAVALIGIVGAVGLMGCPRMPPVSGCQPEAQTCIADAPHVCSASQRWHRAGDLRCRAVGGVCTVMGGRAFCAPVADAGADVGDVE